MSKAELLRRYALFTLSVIVQGMAVACITYADIGTTPGCPVNYVFSLHSSFTLGETTLVFNVLLIVLQVMFIYIGEDSIKKHLFNLIIQLPICFIFSYMIDFMTDTLRQFVSPDMSYLTSWALVIGGTLVMAVAISLSVTANVSMLSGEYFIKVFHPIIKKSFSFVKTFFDIFLVSSAVILSFILTGFTEIEGVREGTVFTAFCTGPMIHFFIPRFKWINNYLKDKNSPAAQ